MEYVKDFRSQENSFVPAPCPATDVRKHAQAMAMAMEPVI